MTARREITRSVCSEPSRRGERGSGGGIPDPAAGVRAVLGLRGAAAIALIAAAQPAAACRPAFDRAAATAAVHAAVVRSMLYGDIQLHNAIDDRLVAIGNRTIPLPGIVEDSSAWTPDKLRDRMPPACRAATTDYLNRRRTVSPVSMPPDVPHSLVHIAAFTTDDWARWYEAGGVIQLSAAGFDSAGENAIVFVSHGCGFLCGTGHFVCLARQSGAWRIRAALGAYFS